jgi:hypothetical protein
MKTYWGTEVQLQIFVTWAQENNLSASPLGRFIPGTRSIGSGLAAIASLDGVNKRIISCPWQESNSFTSVIQPLPSRYTDCGTLAPFLFAVPDYFYTPRLHAEFQRKLFALPFVYLIFSNSSVIYILRLWGTPELIKTVSLHQRRPWGLLYWLKRAYHLQLNTDPPVPPLQSGLWLMNLQTFELKFFSRWLWRLVTFWDVTPCSLVIIYWRYTRHGFWVGNRMSTRRYIPEDRTLQVTCKSEYKANPYSSNEKIRRVSSSGIWRRVLRWVSTDVSEEHIASIFRVEEICSGNQRAISLPPACSLVCWTYFFDPEDGGDMFLRNVVWNSTEYTASYPTRLYSS